MIKLKIFVLYLYFSKKIKFCPLITGTVAEWVRASALSHSEWMVPISNPGEGMNKKCFQVGSSNKVEAILSAPTRGNKYPRRHAFKQAMITLQEMAVFNSLNEKY